MHNLSAQNLKVIICFFVFFILIISISCAQDNSWPFSVYGGKGTAYDTSPKITGYLVLNTKSLGGLTHRTYMKGYRFDTLVNSDTLKGRINLFLLNNHVDVELTNSNVVSIPYFYISYIEGSAFPQQQTRLTRWEVLWPKSDFPFGRLIEQNNNIFMYDCSKQDTASIDKRYVCPMTLYNGHEKIEISSGFRSKRKTLLNFIKKRYGVDISNDASMDVHSLVEYILKKENELQSEKAT